MLSSVESYQRVEKLVRDNEISFYALSKLLGFPSSFFSEWKKGKMMPKTDKLNALAAYFNVPLEYFVKSSSDEES